MRTKMSLPPLVSPGTRLAESEAKATRFPSDETAAGAVGETAEPDASRRASPVA